MGCRVENRRELRLEGSDGVGFVAGVRGLDFDVPAIGKI